MKSSAIFSLAAMACLAPGMIFAQVATQTITLQNGWNAFYLEVTPDEALRRPSDFFADTPVVRAGCYIQDSYEATAQYRSDGSKVESKPLSYRVWIRGNRAATTLANVLGDSIFVAYATNSAAFTVEGAPCVPSLNWRASTAADGILSMVAPSIDDDADVSVSQYFSQGPFGKSGSAFIVGGTNSVSPTFLPVKNSRKLSRGGVIAATAASAAEWPGVLDVIPDDPRGVYFGAGDTVAGFSVANSGKTNRTVRVTYVDSERATDARPALRVNDPSASTNGASWAEFTAIERTLEPGAQWRIQLACDKAQMEDGVNYGALIRVEDASDVTRMRVLLPVTALPRDPESASAAYPQGLWIGEICLAEVSSQRSPAPLPAGGKMKMRVIMHIGADGEPALLQRVLMSREPLPTGALKTRLFGSEAAVPAGLSAHRVSCLFLDTSNSVVRAASTGPGGGAPEFGTRAIFDFVIDQHSSENPFRHTWHPDHDGRNMTFDGPAPSGDDISNYIGEIKPEMFSVTNRIDFVWQDSAGDVTGSWNPDEVTAGRCEWTLGGLIANQEIKMSGTFTMVRVSDIAEIEE